MEICRGTITRADTFTYLVVERKDNSRVIVIIEEKQVDAMKKEFFAEKSSEIIGRRVIMDFDDNTIFFENNKSGEGCPCRFRVYLR